MWFKRAWDAELSHDFAQGLVKWESSELPRSRVVHREEIEEIELSNVIIIITIIIIIIITVIINI